MPKLIPKVIIDTNIVLSALLFSGSVSALVEKWQSGKIHFLITRPILDEYIRALSYPKFELSEADVECLIEEEILPYVTVLTRQKKHTFKLPKISDVDDEKFLEAAMMGRADYLVTGDKVLLQVKKIGITQIVTRSDFLKHIH